MDRIRNKKHSGNWNNQKKSDSRNNNGSLKNSQPSFQFNKSLYENVTLEKERQKAIADLKEREVICPKCGQPITDIASSLIDKATGKPMHFDCALNQVRESETLSENEKIAYIGQGRFGVLYYENMRDQRHFTIKKIIEWEDRDSKPQWREELSGLYSQVN